MLVNTYVSVTDCHRVCNLLSISIDDPVLINIHDNLVNYVHTLVTDRCCLCHSRTDLSEDSREFLDGMYDLHTA